MWSNLQIPRLRGLRVKQIDDCLPVRQSRSYSSSHLSLFAPRLFTWQQQRGILSLPAKTRARRGFASGDLTTKANAATTEIARRRRICISTRCILDSSENARDADEYEVMRRLYHAGEKGSPRETDRGRFRHT